MKMKMKKKISGWSISVEYEDGTTEEIIDIPDWASQPIDDFLTEEIDKLEEHKDRIQNE